jgi:hypothetical protein
MPLTLMRNDLPIRRRVDAIVAEVNPVTSSPSPIPRMHLTVQPWALGKNVMPNTRARRARSARRSLALEPPPWPVQEILSAVALAPHLSSETAYCSGLVGMEASGEDSSQLTSFKRRGAVLAEMLAAGIVLVQCTSAPPPPAATPSPAVIPSRSAASSSTSAPPAPAGGTVEPVTAAELGASWRPGCPVEPGRLRRVNVDHIGFDGQTHRGALIVHEDLV